MPGRLGLGQRAHLRAPRLVITRFVHARDPLFSPLSLSLLTRRQLRSKEIGDRTRRAGSANNSIARSTSPASEQPARAHAELSSAMASLAVRLHLSPWKLLAQAKSVCRSAFVAERTSQEGGGRGEGSGRTNDQCVGRSWHRVDLSATARVAEPASPEADGARIPVGTQLTQPRVLAGCWTRRCDLLSSTI